MKILSWNCHGMGPPWKIQFLKDFIRHQHHVFVFLCETLRSKEKMERVRSRIGFQGMLVVEAHGRSGGLTLLWTDQSQVKLLSMSNNHVDVEISVDNMTPWSLTGFYGEPNRSQRKRTSELLRNLSRDSNLSW